jgi:monovalent cation/hydrogen antiporter
MEGHELELVLLAVLVASAGLLLAAQRSSVPYPIVFVVGGVALGFFPGLPTVELEPDLVLVLFLPPLLYSAAFFTSLRDFRANVRPISLLAIGLVITTMAAVAVVAHAVIDGISWQAAFVLGAVVSPTDAVAPAEILRRLGVPRRVISVVEGESLTNDWTALVAYKFAVAAVVTGSFSLAEAGPKFIATGLGGIAIGVAVGIGIAAVRRRLDDPPTEITISLLTAYAAYLPAEEVGASGVLAAVTVGVWLGWQASDLTTPASRLQLAAIWEILQFLLNAFLFVLIGLQLPVVFEAIDGRSTAELAGYGALIGVLVAVVRVAWVFACMALPLRLFRRVRGDQPLPGWKGATLVAWSSMRGAVALAAALAIPLETDAGAPFPGRDLIIFLAFAVILVTLVGQGLTLSPLIEWFGVHDDGEETHEDTLARRRVAEAALARLEELGEPEWISPESVGRARQLFDYRQRRFGALEDGDGDNYEERADAWRRLMYDLYDAQREALLELRNTGAISDEVRRRVERDIDLEETRIEN